MSCNGICKRWIADRGFGFVKKDEGGEFFVHVRELQRAGIESLSVGERITFDEKLKDGKPVAVNIRVLK